MTHEDTVMSMKQLAEINSNMPPEAKYGEVFEVIADKQAEISFKAGFKYALEGAVIEGGYQSVKKAGIREVVKWIEANYPIGTSKWQAQLKVWDIK